MEWISVKDELPDAKKYWVLVFAPNGLYEEDLGKPTIDKLFWYKSNFGDFHEETMGKITHWMPLPELPKE